jgi:uncharacterized membrane protein YheB (UPF0754 family)
MKYLKFILLLFFLKVSQAYLVIGNIRQIGNHHVSPPYLQKFETVVQNLSTLEDTPRVSSPSQWERSIQDMKRNPWPFITIPIVAACVGYITNLLGVKMLFYPITWRGIPIHQYLEQPFGWFGWQGIVPAKRFKMANKMVDVTISKLIDVQEIFSRLEPKEMSKLLLPTVKDEILGGWCPNIFSLFFLRRACANIIKNAEKIFDLRHLVVTGLTDNPATLGSFFQTVGKKELKFLVNSGFGIGFVLGIFQMLQWMVYPKPWTLPAGGAVVGYITNWIALKWIFEPLVPVNVGPFIFQGMFLQRQPEVAEQFSAYIAGVTLSSQRAWKEILSGSQRGKFASLVGEKVPLPRSQIDSIVTRLRATVGATGRGIVHPMHDYCNTVLALRATLETKMKAMTSAEFEQVLHPIFQEDELTLILAGAALGAVAGGLQWWLNDVAQKRKLNREKATQEPTINIVPS